MVKKVNATIRVGKKVKMPYTKERIQAGHQGLRKRGAGGKR